MLLSDCLQIEPEKKIMHADTIVMDWPKKYLCSIRMIILYILHNFELIVGKKNGYPYLFLYCLYSF